MEYTIKGISASKGYAVGKVFILERKDVQLNYDKIEDTKAEVARFEESKKEAIDQLKALYVKAVETVGEEHGEIFNIHSMMLEDLDYNDSILALIKEENYSAEVAVDKTKDAFFTMFYEMDDEYMKARSADIVDVSKRLINNILGVQESSLDNATEPMIIVAKDLFPSDTLQLDKSKVLAFVTDGGSKNSHTAILARTLNIPAIVNTIDAFDTLKNNSEIIVDGFEGELIISPTEETISSYKDKLADLREKEERLLKYKEVKSATLDGVTVDTYANIGNTADLHLVLENGAGGIGLFRSEFIYLDSDDFPTEDYQYNIYREVLSRMEGKRVIIRTLDLGADKQADYFNIPDEENPAMGYRAIRICLNEDDVFEAQLRALYRASVHGKLAIMFPMVINEAEMKGIIEAINKVKADLTKEGIPFKDDVEVGIMIETPAAAVISDILAQYVDFFSIGTNDLTQYTLAVDRMNSKIAHLYDYADPAVLRLMKMTVDNGHKHNTWVGICGESASDISLTETYIAMGIDELSCSPKYVLEVREKVVNSNAAELKEKITF